MRVGHTDDLMIFDQRDPALVILPLDASRQDPFLHIEFLLPVEDLDGLPVEPRPVIDTEVNHQPIRTVDKILVINRPVGDFRSQRIVHPGDVCARIVYLRGVRPGQRSACTEVTVAQRAQGFTQAFLLRIKIAVNQLPRGHVAKNSNTFLTSGVSQTWYSASDSLVSSATKIPKPFPLSTAKASSSVVSSPI